MLLFKFADGSNGRATASGKVGIYYRFKSTRETVVGQQLTLFRSVVNVGFSV